MAPRTRVPPVVIASLAVLLLCGALSGAGAARPKGIVTPKKVAKFMKWFEEQGECTASTAGHTPSVKVAWCSH